MWICPFFLGKPWGLLDGSTSSRGWKLCPIGVSRLDCRDGGRSFFFMGISSIQWDKGFWLNMTISYHIMYIIPSGKHTTNYGKSPFSMGKSTLNPPNNYSNWCFKHFLFSIIHGIILPIDKYFSEGLKPPTSIDCSRDLVMDQWIDWHDFQTSEMAWSHPQMAYNQANNPTNRDITYVI